MSHDNYMRDLQDAINGVLLCYGLPELDGAHDVMMRLHYYRKRSAKAERTHTHKARENRPAMSVRAWERKRGDMEFFNFSKMPCRFIGYTEAGDMKVIIWEWREVGRVFVTRDIAYDGRFKLQRMVKEGNDAFNALSRANILHYADPLEYYSASEIINGE